MKEWIASRQIEAFRLENRVRPIKWQFGGAADRIEGMAPNESSRTVPIVCRHLLNAIPC